MLAHDHVSDAWTLTEWATSTASPTKTIEKEILHTKVLGALSNLLYTVHRQFTHAQLMFIGILLYNQQTTSSIPKTGFGLLNELSQ